MGTGGLREAPGDAAGGPPRPGPATLVVCCAAIFMPTLDQTVLNVAIPAIQANLHANAAGLQWTVDGYILARASTLFLCGSLSDRFGRKATFDVGLSMFVLGSLICALAPDLGVLVAFRIFQGLASALMTPASLAILTNTYTEAHQRARAIGVWSATSGLSMGAGPVLGGILVETFGWRSVFFINVPVGLLALAGTRLLAESKAVTRRPFDAGGQFALGAGLATLTYALIDGPGAGWSSPVVIGLLAASACLGIGFVRFESRRAHPLFDLAYLKRPLLYGATILAIVAYLAFGGYLFFDILYLQDVRGFSPLDAGLLLIPATAAPLLFSPLASRIGARRGPRLPATSGMVLIAVSMGAMALFLGTRSGLLLLVLGALAIGAGQGLVNPIITNAGISGLPAQQAGVAAAIATTGRQVGNNLGVALIGSVIFSLAPALTTGGSLSGAVAAGAFVSGLRWGYLLVTICAAGGTAVAAHAFASRSAILQTEEPVVR